MRDRLIELLKSPHKAEWLRQHGYDIGQYEEDCIEAMLADFLLANGVIVPPCKVGDTVYVIQLCEIYECRVNEICMSAGNNNVVVLDRFTNGFIIRRYGAEYFNAFGKTVFLTREEAEKALAERAEK